MKNFNQNLLLITYLISFVIENHKFLENLYFSDEKKISTFMIAKKKMKQELYHRVIKLFIVEFSNLNKLEKFDISIFIK